ncbi:MAG: hypothetical protein ACYC2H_03775 [Thermoplasmatota archaeon]
MTVDASVAPPLGQRPNEPTPGKDSLANPQGRAEDGRGTCPDCGLPFGEHPEYHAHGSDGEAGNSFDTPGDVPGGRLDEREQGGDPAEA